MNIYLKYFLHDFTDIDQAPIDIQMGLIDLQERTDLKAKYVEMNFGDFYQKYLDQDKFPNLRKFMTSKMELFGSTSLCEQFFSKMGFMKSSYRSVTTNKHLENGLRVASTSIKVNFNRLFQKKASWRFLTELFLQKLNCIAML